MGELALKEWKNWQQGRPFTAASRQLQKRNLWQAQCKVSAWQKAQDTKESTGGQIGQRRRAEPARGEWNQCKN